MAIYNMKLTALVLMVLLSMNFIAALGVSTSYWKDNPLDMYPGQTKEITFTLTNKPDEETARAIVSIDERTEIAQLISGSEYNVAPGTANTKVTLKIIIPETAEIGNIYNVGFSVKAAPSEEEGTVQLGVQYKIDFPVRVVSKSEVSETITEKPQTSSLLKWIVAITLVVLIIILAVVLRKKK